MNGKLNPVITWHSDPVRPDETLLISGSGFDDGIVVEMAKLKDADKNVFMPVKFKPENATWVPVSILDKDDCSLKVLVPASWNKGIYACRVRKDKSDSRIILVNFPDAWWMQGDAGFEATSGGWLRVFGKNLNISGKSSVMICRPGKRPLLLSPKEATCYTLAVDIPKSIAPAIYQVWVHNGCGGNVGWQEVGRLCVRKPASAGKFVLNVKALGARPNTDLNCTPYILKGLNLLKRRGGGILFFPRGRYRIDAMRKGGKWLDTSLKIPGGVTLRGESMELVNLWWPDQKEPVPSLIDGGSNFTVEDMSIYIQGVHRNIISGNNHVRIRRVRIRANCCYMMNVSGHRKCDELEIRAKSCHPLPKETHVWRLEDKLGQMGAAIFLKGQDVQVTDCDLYHSRYAIECINVRDALITNNVLKACGYVFYGGERVIFEKNQYSGHHLTASGGSIALYGSDNNACRHYYYAHNVIQQMYGGDREALTFDGHGHAYIGKIKNIKGRKITLMSVPVFGWENKHKFMDTWRDMMRDWHGAVIFVVDGKGVGQYRHITQIKQKTVEIDRGFDVVPDASSIVHIGAFNGRHLLIGNTFADTGSSIQLYPPNCECIVAENKGYRAGNFNCGGVIFGLPGKIGRVEPSWYNQFLDNSIEEGNGWGGLVSKIDGSIGGEAVINIYGTNADHRYPIHISRGHIVRRNLLKNNSAIRVIGAVNNVVIEKNTVSNNEYAVELSTADDRIVKGIDEASPTPLAIKPGSVLLRGNKFRNVDNSLIGNAVENRC